MTIFRSNNVYRSMSAMTSLLRLATSNKFRMARFYFSVCEVDPFTSHAESLVSALDDSNPDKRYFSALVRLVKASAFPYNREEDMPRNIRERLIELVRAYRFVLYV